MRFSQLAVRSVFATVAFALGVCGQSGTVAAQDRLTWSGTGAASANQVWGIQASNIMSKYSGTRVVITDSPGSAANIDRMRTGKAHLGHVTTDNAFNALNGLEEYKGNAYPELRTLLMVHLLPLFIAVSQESGVMRLQDLEGKAFSPGPPGFATSALAMKQFEVLGIKPNWFLGSVADSVNAMKDGRVAGMVRAGGVPDANLSEIAVTRPIRLLSPTDPELTRLQKEIPTATALAVRVPAGTYNGVPEIPAYRQMGFGLFVGINTGVSQTVGYNLVKAVLDNWAEGLGSLENFRALDPGKMADMTLKYASVPLHAGTVQYLKEKGINVPANLVPKEFK